ncbi:SDR family NAD(P)-dependent oxidoreductase [bacterium]|nr:SDR family NAD(P)-dependent oxidoreductase [bacterium]
MGEKVLVTGGAGFIGSHLVDGLIEEGYEVRIFDNLDPQVHQYGEIPEYLNKEAEFVHGDVRDRDALKRALDGVRFIFHEAAAVGVGQSMYEIYHYTEVNTLGCANLLDILVNTPNSCEKLLVASSMSIYGEGKYSCGEHGVIFPKLRPEKQLHNREWEMKCPLCGEEANKLPTDEDKSLYPTSIYAINKRDHEEMVISTGIAYKIPAVALRYFNVYGSRQALSNPYTGVMAIFSSRILNDNSPFINEDGNQTRDFIHVNDVVRANIECLKNDAANYQVFNVGSGKPLTILGIAESLIKILGKEDRIKPVIANKFRAGDIRHCFSDTTKIEKTLGISPRVSFDKGFSELIDWVSKQKAADLFDIAQKELEKRGLTT